MSGGAVKRGKHLILFISALLFRCFSEGLSFFLLLAIYDSVQNQKEWERKRGNLFEYRVVGFA
jgi:hypothetical protein